jgi:hypothetical protein
MTFFVMAKPAPAKPYRVGCFVYHDADAGELPTSSWLDGAITFVKNIVQPEPRTRTGGDGRQFPMGPGTGTKNAEAPEIFQRRQIVPPPAPGAPRNWWR